MKNNNKRLPYTNIKKYIFFLSFSWIEEAGGEEYVGKILEFGSRFINRPLEPVWAGYETEYPACFVAKHMNVQWTFFEAIA